MPLRFHVRGEGFPCRFQAEQAHGDDPDEGQFPRALKLPQVAYRPVEGEGARAGRRHATSPPSGLYVSQSPPQDGHAICPLFPDP